MIYFTSDLHLNHFNIIKYCNRPFENVKEMNEALIDNWNSIVTDEDTVYVLGDFILGPADEVPTLLKRLNGTIILVRGNHDTRSKLAIYEKLGVEIKDIAYIPYKGRYFICCHFPIANEEFIRMVIEDNSEVVALYGHVHDVAQPGYVNGTYHVGVDTNGFKPISIETIWQNCWPEVMMTPDIKQYKDTHDQNPDLEQMVARELAQLCNSTMAQAASSANQISADDIMAAAAWVEENKIPTLDETINNIMKIFYKESIKI